MIDDLVIVMEIDSPESIGIAPEAPFGWQGITFSPFYRKGMVIKHTGELGNLRLVINSSQLTISGSLHKFYHGNNSGDFTWREIQAALERLAKVIGEEFAKAQLKRLTFACNIPVDAKPILDRLISIKCRKPADMLGGINHRPYGKYIKMTHSRLKIYNKKEEVAHHDRRGIQPTLRIEIELNLKAASSRQRNPIDLKTIGELLDPKFADFCKQELIALVNQFEFTQEVLPSDCASAGDLECLALMRDFDTRLNYKKRANPKTFRKKLKRYQELCKESGSCDLKQTLLTMVEDKIEELTNLDQTLRKTG